MLYILAMAFAITLISVAGTARRSSVQVTVGAVFFLVVAIASIWILPIAWLLAVVGLLLAIAGGIWRALSKTKSPGGIAHPSGGLLWPGLGLLGAPFANAFVLMPILNVIFRAA